MATIAAKAITFYHPDALAPTTTVAVRAPQFGDKDTIDRRDVIQETAAGELIVYQRGPPRIIREMDLSFLPQDEKSDLLNFFFQVSYGAAQTWDLKVPNWSGKGVKVYAGATIAGSVITAGGGYVAGQTANVDHIFYTGCTFEDSAMAWAQVRDGWFSSQIKIRAKGMTF